MSFKAYKKKVSTFLKIPTNQKILEERMKLTIFSWEEFQFLENENSFRQVEPPKFSSSFLLHSSPRFLFVFLIKVNLKQFNRMLCHHSRQREHNAAYVLLMQISVKQVGGICARSMFARYNSYSNYCKGKIFVPQPTACPEK